MRLPGLGARQPRSMAFEVSAKNIGLRLSKWFTCYGYDAATRREFAYSPLGASLNQEFQTTQIRALQKRPIAKGVPTISETYCLRPHDSEPLPAKHNRDGLGYDP